MQVTQDRDQNVIIWPLVTAAFERACTTKGSCTRRAHATKGIHNPPPTSFEDALEHPPTNSKVGLEQTISLSLGLMGGYRKRLEPERSSILLELLEHFKPPSGGLKQPPRTRIRTRAQTKFKEARTSRLLLRSILPLYPCLWPCTTSPSGEEFQFWGTAPTPAGRPAVLLRTTFEQQRQQLLVQQMQQPHAFPVAIPEATAPESCLGRGSPQPSLNCNLLSTTSSSPRLYKPVRSLFEVFFLSEKGKQRQTNIYSGKRRFLCIKCILSLRSNLF